MKKLRILATVFLGAYLFAMGVPFIGMSLDLAKKGLSPYSAEAPAAFFFAPADVCVEHAGPLGALEASLEKCG